jgi:hypothetical protein
MRGNNQLDTSIIAPRYRAHTCSVGSACSLSGADLLMAIAAPGSTQFHKPIRITKSWRRSTT